MLLTNRRELLFETAGKTAFQVFKEITKGQGKQKFNMSKHLTFASKALQDADTLPITHSDRFHDQY